VAIIFVAFDSILLNLTIPYGSDSSFVTNHSK